jgi:hypothetical protein
MFCRNCGSPLEVSDTFCSKCGSGQSASVSTHVPAPVAASGKRSRRIWLYGSVALCLVFILKACSDLGSSDAHVAATAQPTSVHHKLGENITVGYWSYRCDSADWRTSIGSAYAPEYPDASFLVVNLGVRNNDKTASVLPPLKLVDAQGREYDESSKGIFLDKSFGMLKNVNPGVTSFGNLVFDVPRGQYSVKVSGGFTSQDTVLIDLQ